MLLPVDTPECGQMRPSLELGRSQPREQADVAAELLPIAAELIVALDGARERQPGPGRWRNRARAVPRPRCMRRRAAAVLFVLLGIVATGCATARSGSGGGTAGLSGPTASSSTAAPTPTGPTESGSITVDGVVEHGVEPGCLVLPTGPGAARPVRQLALIRGSA